MIQPNNLRNRWRRYRVTRKAYGFTCVPFRQWAQHASATSYSCHPDGPDERVPLIACRCKALALCTCYRPAQRTLKYMSPGY